MTPAACPANLSSHSTAAWSAYRAILILEGCATPMAPAPIPVVSNPLAHGYGTALSGSPPKATTKTASCTYRETHTHNRAGDFRTSIYHFDGPHLSLSGQRTVSRNNSFCACLCVSSVTERIHVQDYHSN